MKFPGNCVIVAATFSLLPGYSLRWMRNRRGRLHFFWTDRSGHAWEFYKKGSSGRTYWQNALYVGEIKRV